MFNKNLGTCPLSDNESNSFFTNIIGRGEWHFKSDYTLIALTRALLHKRLKDNQTFNISIRNPRYNLSTFDRNRAADIIDSMLDGYYHYDGIILVNANCPDEVNARMFSMFDNPENGFVRLYGYHEAMDLRQFVSRLGINARFYFKDDPRSTVILVEKMELKTYHTIISLLPRYIKWFTQELPLDAEEKELCRSLTEPYSLRYERMIDEFCKRIDFRAHKIRRVMGNFERNSLNNMLNDARNEVQHCEANISENMRRYTELVSMRSENVLRVNGILKSIEDLGTSESELLKYLIRTKSMNPVHTNGSIFTVIIDSYMDIFDPNAFMRMSRNDRSCVFSGHGNLGNIERCRRFLNAIFSDEPVLKIKTCACFNIDTRGEASAISSYRYPGEYRDILPNPHLDRWSCIGQNRKIMNECLLRNDVVGCLMQCMASTKMLNFSDTTVISHFMPILYETSKKCIELPDHTCVSPKDALAWLEARDAAEKKAKEEAEAAARAAAEAAANAEAEAEDQSAAVIETDAQTVAVEAAELTETADDEAANVAGDDGINGEDGEEAPADVNIHDDNAEWPVEEDHLPFA